MRQEGSTKVLPGFHPPGFQQGSTRFCKGFEVRFHEGFRVPRGSARCGMVSDPQAFQKCSARLRGLPWRMRSEDMGGTLSKTELEVFQHTFTVLSLAHLLRQRGSKCWLCGKSDHVAAGLTVQQSKCLALLSISWWALGSKNSTRLQGLSGTSRARLHRWGPIGPDCAIAPVGRAQSTAPSWHRLVLPKELHRRVRLHHPDQALEHHNLALQKQNPLLERDTNVIIFR